MKVLAYRLNRSFYCKQQYQPLLKLLTRSFNMRASSVAQSPTGGSFLMDDEYLPDLDKKEIEY